MNSISHLTQTDPILPGLNSRPYAGDIRQALDQAEDAREATLFASRASFLISSRLDPKIALSRAARVTIPYLADWCVIDLLQGDGFRRAEVAYRYADDASIATALRQNSLTRAGLDEFSTKILDGSAIHIDLTQRPELSACYAPLEAASLILAPLINKDRFIGVISLFFTKSGRQFTQSQCLIAQELANQVALINETSQQFQDTLNAIKVRDEFISVAVHELRNPLTTLKLQVGMLHRLGKTENIDAISTSTVLNMSTTIARSVEKLQLSIDRLFDVSLMRSGQLSLRKKTINLTNLIEDSVVRLSDDIRAADCDIRLNLCPGLFAMVDPFRIEQVVVNLVTNAFKYAPSSPIDVALSVLREDTAVLTVKDYGPGIRPSDQKRIFECFERGSPMDSSSGLGLGLYIVKKIVNAHRGKIRLESEPGQGARFIVEIPLDQEKKQESDIE